MVKEGWKKIKLGELGSFSNGVNFKRSAKGSGYKLINVKDLFKGHIINFSGLDKVNLTEKKNLKNYFVKKGDLFFSRSSVKRDGVAVVNMAKKSDNKTVHCGFIIRLRIEASSVDNLYITYLLRSPMARKKLINISGGAAIINVTQDTLSKFEIEIPEDINEQQKIATILSNYDDLIENNTKRIQLLERMAKLIYDEWFVKFRFPGHETVKMVDSELGKIPEGWEVKKIGDVLSSLESGFRPKGGVGKLKHGIPSIGAENINGLGNYNYSKEKFISSEFFNKMKRGIVKHKDVLLYKDGAKIGRKTMFRNNFPHKICCINEHAFILRTRDYRYQNYLYFWLDQHWMTESIINLNANAAQPGINQQGVKSLQFLQPSKDIIAKFDEILEQILSELFNLAKKNKNLSKTRDLILPKLISGQVDVSDLDIQLPEVEA